ncbi:hypothetical protein JCM33374_g6008 [Metschnikowia sp. JCM 33374]|nr:hypothetical protein JCM33374_g6008 [Metschnikowia sp. JCM 33374]
MLNLRRIQNKKFFGGVSILLALCLIYALGPKISASSFITPPVIYVDSQTGDVLQNFEPKSQSLTQEKDTAKAPIKPGDSDHNPIKDAHEEEEAALQQINQGHSGKSSSNNGDCVIPGKRVKATFVSLARNSELYDLINAIRNVEDRFNRKFNYDWVFLNDEPFTEEFKRVTSAIVSGTAKYGLVPEEHWSYPDFIDKKKAARARKAMSEAGIIYGDSESYRHMCRFESGFFFRHPLMEEYDWYWRVEPGIKIHCDLNYDLFKYMEDNNKVYGFTISIHEFEKTITTLWKHTKEFMNLHPEHIAKDNFMKFISNDDGKTYNLCHFWSNFEVASLKFWRSQAYTDYFDYLDKQGGFFYERWGDAPVHSIAASLFLPKDAIHFFSDVGYNHGVYTQCPLNEQFRFDHKCDCNPDSDFTFRGYSCGNKYYEAMELEKPKEWVDYQ